MLVSGSLLLCTRMVNVTRLGCPMGDGCILEEGDKVGGRFLTPPDLSTQGDTLAMLNLHAPDPGGA